MSKYGLMGSGVFFLIAAFIALALNDGMRMEARAHEGENDSHNGSETAHDEHQAHMIEVREWLKEELGDEYDDPIPASTREQVERGREIYQTRCAPCHGTEGRGNGPVAKTLDRSPADFTDPEHSGFYSDRGRIHIIRNGIQDTPMVGWGAGMSDEEIYALYAYVKSLRAPDSDEHEEEKKGE